MRDTDGARKTVAIRASDVVPGEIMAKAPAATMQILIGPEQGSPDFVMRRFTIEAGGKVPLHSHDALEHVQYILEGEMVLVTADGERVLRAEDALCIPAGVAHGYENRTSLPVRFLCTVPVRVHETKWMG